MTTTEYKHLSDATIALSDALGAIEVARFHSDGSIDNTYKMLVEQATRLCEDITAMVEPRIEDAFVLLEGGVR